VWIGGHWASRRDTGRSGFRITGNTERHYVLMKAAGINAEV